MPGYINNLLEPWILYINQKMTNDGPQAHTGRPVGPPTNHQPTTTVGFFVDGTSPLVPASHQPWPTCRWLPTGSAITWSYVHPPPGDLVGNGEWMERGEGGEGCEGWGRGVCFMKIYICVIYRQVYIYIYVCDIDRSMHIYIYVCMRYVYVLYHT